MKIDLSLAPIDKDGGSRSPAGTEGDRGAMGDAFGRAVRDAEGKRSASSNGKSSKAVEANGSVEVEPKQGGDAAADAAGDTEAGGETENAAVPIQTLLGALAALTKQAVAAQGGRQASSGDGKGEGDAAPTRDAGAGPIDVPEAATGKTKGAMKLDVVRMETHFEPHQDGMVLVEGAALSKTAADAKAKSAATDAGVLSASLADASRIKSADAKAGAAEGNSLALKDDALPPMRFDEALARLGRAGGERSGGESSRDGSAAAQAALAELASRRSTTRVADAASGTGSVDLGASATTSPYNLAGQVAGPIMEALGETAQAPAQQPAPGSNDAHLRMRAGGGALKTLTIQLHPEHLGTVDVSMRLNEGRLTLELAASRSDTASMLLDDQASLRKLLEHAGFSLDDAAISVVTRDSGQVRTGDPSSAGSQQRDAGGNSAGEGRPDPRGQSSGSDERPGRRQPPSRGSDDARPAASRSGSTYL